MVKGKSAVDIHWKDQGVWRRRNEIENGRWEMCDARQVAIFAASEKYCTQIHCQSE